MELRIFATSNGLSLRKIRFNNGRLVILKAAFEQACHDAALHLASQVEGTQPRGWVRPCKYLHRQSEGRPYARQEV